MQRCSWLCEINTSHRQTRLCKCPPYSTSMDAISSNCNAAFAVAPLTARDKTRILRRDLSSRSFHIGPRPKPPTRSILRYVTTTNHLVDGRGRPCEKREGRKPREAPSSSTLESASFNTCSSLEGLGLALNAHGGQQPLEGFVMGVLNALVSRNNCPTQFSVNEHFPPGAPSGTAGGREVPRVHLPTSVFGT